MTSVHKLHCATLVAQADKGLRDLGFRTQVLSVLMAVARIVDSMGGGRSGGSRVEGVTARGLARLTRLDRETVRRALGDLAAAGIIDWDKAGGRDSGSIELLRQAVGNLWVDVQAYFHRVWLRRSFRAAREFSRTDSAGLSQQELFINKGIEIEAGLQGKPADPFHLRAAARPGSFAWIEADRRCKEWEFAQT